MIFANLMTLIGLASIIDDLQVWKSLVGSALRGLHSLTPVIAQAASHVGGLVHGGLESYREAVHEPISFYFLELGFYIPAAVIDISIAFIFAVLGVFRAAALTCVVYPFGKNRLILELRNQGASYFESLQIVEKLYTLEHKSTYSEKQKSDYIRLKAVLERIGMPMAEFNSKYRGYLFGDNSELQVQIYNYCVIFIGFFGVLTVTLGTIDFIVYA
jgi:hypothetical protein